MSIFKAIFDAGKVYNFEQVFGTKDITTSEMKQAIADWYDLYYGSTAARQQTAKTPVNACRLP